MPNLKVFPKRFDILDGIRLVFAKPDLKEPYEFVGVFVSDKMDYLKHSYKRIATKVRLIGDPVYQIEILDDSGS